MRERVYSASVPGRTISTTNKQKMFDFSLSFLHAKYILTGERGVQQNSWFTPSVTLLTCLSRSSWWHQAPGCLHSDIFPRSTEVLCFPLSSNNIKVFAEKMPLQVIIWHRVTGSRRGETSTSTLTYESLRLFKSVHPVCVHRAMKGWIQKDLWSTSEFLVCCFVFSCRKHL